MLNKLKILTTILTSIVVNKLSLLILIILNKISSRTLSLRVCSLEFITFELRLKGNKNKIYPLFHTNNQSIN